MIFVIVLFASLAIGLLWLIHWADRRRIARLIEETGGRVIEIRQTRASIPRALLALQSTTFWTVRYRAADGTLRVAECFASFLRCRIHRDLPADPTRYCRACGYNLTGNTSGVCPECGAPALSASERIS